MAQERAYATFYNNAPPGAGNLRWGGYSFAELWTARRTDGGATGHGWIARLFGVKGELPMGFGLYINHHGRTIYARKQDRGYGQGGDGITSDPAYALDLYDGSRWGLPNLPAALRWTPNDWVYLLVSDAALKNLRAGQGAEAVRLTARGPVPKGVPTDPTLDYHLKVIETGRRQSLAGNDLRQHSARLRGLVKRHARL